MGKSGEDAMREGIKLAKKLQQCIIQCASLCCNGATCCWPARRDAAAAVLRHIRQLGPRIRKHIGAARRDGGLAFQRHLWQDFKQVCVWDMSQQDLTNRALLVRPPGCGQSHTHARQLSIRMQRRGACLPLLGSRTAHVRDQRRTETSRLGLRQHETMVSPSATLLQGNPLALTKMASFFFDAYYQKKKKYKPLVLIGPVDAEGDCNVVGFSGPPASSSKVRAPLLARAIAVR